MWYRKVRNWYVKEAWWFGKRFGRFEMLRWLASGLWMSKGEGSGVNYADSDVVRAQWYSRLTKVCQVTSWRPSNSFRYEAGTIFHYPSSKRRQERIVT